MFPNPKLDVKSTPRREDFLATECKDNLAILLDIDAFPSSKYFDTVKEHKVNILIFMQENSVVKS